VTKALKDDIKKLGNVRRALTILRRVEWSKVPELTARRNFSRAGEWQIFQKPKSHLKIQGARRLAWNKFQTEDPEILGVTVKNIVTNASWHRVFLHP
jgi:hypothetical protein